MAVDEATVGDLYGQTPELQAILGETLKAALKVDLDVMKRGTTANRVKVAQKYTGLLTRALAKGQQGADTEEWKSEILAMLGEMSKQLTGNEPVGAEGDAGVDAEITDPFVPTDE